MIQVGDKVKVTKGNREWRIRKGDSAVVRSIEELERREVRIVLWFSNGWMRGKSKLLFARHVNRLVDVEVRLNNGDPTLTIEIKKV